MPNSEGLLTRTLLETLSDIDSGKVSTEEVALACLGRIAEREDDVAAWQVCADEASVLAAARAATTGALRGIPVGIKDLIDTVDLPTGYGSPIYSDHRPTWDASCVTTIQSEGGVVVGKTVTTEFAYFQPGKTRNPHDLGRTPGGSSSGSAAAVADGHVFAALGTQTAGSVIRPASYCGVVGFKPSYGLLDLTGVRALAPSLDHLGVFCRTVADAAYLTSVLARRPKLALGGEFPNSPRIGFCRTFEWDKAEAATQVRLEDVADRLAKSGATIRDITLPAAFAGLADAQATVMDVEASFTAAFEVANHRDQISQKFLDRVAAGRSYAPEKYDEARHQAVEANAMLDDVFADCDVLLCPSAPGEAPEGLDATGDPIFNRVWTMLGTPCVNVPGVKGENDMPIGVQIVGRFNDDQRTLSVAQWVQHHLT